MLRGGQTVEDAIRYLSQSNSGTDRESSQTTRFKATASSQQTTGTIASEQLNHISGLVADQRHMEILSILHNLNSCIENVLSRQAKLEEKLAEIKRPLAEGHPALPMDQKSDVKPLAGVTKGSDACYHNGEARNLDSSDPILFCSPPRHSDEQDIKRLAKTSRKSISHSSPEMSFDAYFASVKKHHQGLNASNPMRPQSQQHDSIDETQMWATKISFNCCDDRSMDDLFNATSINSSATKNEMMREAGLILKKSVSISEGNAPTNNSSSDQENSSFFFDSPG